MVSLSKRTLVHGVSTYASKSVTKCAITLDAITQYGTVPWLRQKSFFQSQASPCGICGWQIDTETNFSLSTFVFPCLCLFTDAPHPLSPTLQKLRLSQPR